ncbi:Mariner transposase, partial [Caligus rogercresseyi]
TNNFVNCVENGEKRFRVLISIIICGGKTIAETKAKLDKYYGDSAPSISMVKKWFTEFRCGRTCTIDSERSGRPVEVATPETIQKIHDMVLADRRLTVQEIVEAIGISHGYLAMKKLSARWVPRLLTIEHKRNRVTTSMECLALFNRNKDDGLNMDILQHTRDQAAIKSMGLKGESAPKKAKVGLSTNKVMATVFWDAQKVLFHQDNARVHTCVVSMAKFYELRYELLPHPPYSSDLAPSDYFLFPNLKKWLA